MAIITKPVSFSGHWYHKDGTPQHKVQASDGSTRSTHLGDARKLGLLPSVTSILTVLDKPGLDKWKINQAIMACLRTPRQKDEGEVYYCRRVADVAYRQVDDAAELGSAIHHEIHRFLIHDHTKGDFVPGKTQIGDKVYDLGPYVKPVIDWMVAKNITVKDPEKVLVNAQHGYAGTSDAPYVSPKTFGILDYKSRKTEPDKEIEAWPEQVLQIAAYFAAYWGEAALLQPNAWGGNVYISSTEPGRVCIALYPPTLLRAAWSTFLQICSIWRFFNQFDPRLPVDQQVAWPQATMINLARPGELPMDNTPTSQAPSQAPSPAVTILSLLNEAKQDNMCDGIEFLSPSVCAGFTPGRVKTDYAWWYHAATNTAKVGLFGDAALSTHGWQNAFFAYPKHVKDEHAASHPPKPEAKPKETPPAKPTKEDKAKDKARLKELEAMTMNFGKFKDKTLKEAPSSYLDWLRDQVNKEGNKIPSHVREYVLRPDVIKSIEQDLDRKDRK